MGSSLVRPRLFVLLLAAALMLLVVGAVQVAQSSYAQPTVRSEGSTIMKRPLLVQADNPTGLRKPL